MSADLAEPTATRTDKAGRELLVRQLDALEELDLIEAAGEMADNSRWLSQGRVACAVREIDKRPLPMPRDRDGCRDVVRRVGRAGIEAAVAALFPAASKAEAETRAAEGNAAAKN